MYSGESLNGNAHGSGIAVAENEPLEKVHGTFKHNQPHGIIRK